MTKESYAEKYEKTATALRANGLNSQVASFIVNQEERIDRMTELLSKLVNMETAHQENPKKEGLPEYAVKAFKRIIDIAMQPTHGQFDYLNMATIARYALLSEDAGL